VHETVQRLGRIDLVMLNAGGAPALDMRTMGAREVTAYMRSNYDVAVNYLFPVLHQMVHQGSGVVAYPGFIGTEATANDGMPAPLELSEARAVEHLVSLWLPKWPVTRVLRSDVPPLAAERVGAPRVS
jgi:hypothetical protein